MTPAAPNTYVVSREPSASEGFVREPVIGYVYASADNKPPTVVTLQGQRRVLGEDAVLFPCGTTVDPLNGLTFATVEEWLEFNPKTARPGEDKPKAATKPKAAPEADETPTGYDIEWTNKSFKNNSFWHYDDGHFEFCFTLPGEEDAPKATEKLTKIKRDELMALKKTIDHLDLDDVKNPDILEDADAEEDEIDQSPDDEDDDDDGLI